MTYTPDEVKSLFEAEGMSIREWAIRHNFKPHTVYCVLNGKLKAKRGVSHKIAVALKLKREPSEPIFSLTTAA